MITPAPIERYAAEHTTPPTELLARLAEETRETLRSPQMLTGPIEGRFLELVVHGIGAKRVLELGTYSGYSSISMAAALPPGGHIDTCEVEKRHAEVARRYIEEAGYADRITVHLGPAIDTIRGLEGSFDFVFVDADKPSYLAYYEELLPRLSPNGLMAVDNTLWSGRVLEPDGDESTQAIVAFNDHVRDDPRSVCAMLSVRDGITLIRRA
jgi:caffeoyl-CoA O-methyltransferase